MEFCNLPDKIMCSMSECWKKTPCKTIEKCMFRLYDNIVSEFTCMCYDVKEDVHSFEKPLCNNITVERSSSIGNEVEDKIDNNIYYIIISICVLCLLLCLYCRSCIYKNFCYICKKNLRTRSESNA